MYARCAQYTSAGMKKTMARISEQLCGISRAPRAGSPEKGFRIRLYTPGGEEEISDDDTMREGRIDGDEGKYAH